MHIAIIAEYNPFHSGHAYQLSEVRRVFGKDCKISVILGGIFSQRGEPYVAPPYTRAAAAIFSGADLVLEMPFPFSSSPAAVFARAGVEIAEKIGADLLVFGSECGSLDTLYSILQRLESDELRASVMQKSKDNTLGKTRAFAKAFAELYGNKNRLDTPNDILGIEYLRAIKNLGAKIKPYTILRKGDYKSGEGEFPSASSLRRAYSEGGISEIQCGMPEKAFEVFLDAEKNGLFAPDIEKLAGAALLKLTEDTATSDIAFSGGGIIGRLKSAAKGAKSISELLSAAATKRYTDAEISRALLYTLFSVKRSNLDEEVHYTKLLAANSRGREILNEDIKIELVTKPSDMSKLSEKARQQYERTFLAERAYALCLDGDYEAMLQSPKVVK